MKHFKVELGCGKAKHKGWIGVDIYPFPGVDFVCDVTKDGLPFEDNSVDYIYSQDFLEHIQPDRKAFVINEIWRVLKPNMKMEHFIPNAGSRNDFGSPSHLSHWSLQQFEHFDIDSYRYEKDKDYEGFNGGFKKVLAELVNVQLEGEVYRAQSIHVIYSAVK